MIRICHVVLFPFLGGAERAMLDLLQQLDRSRYQSHVACKEAGPLTEELLCRKIPAHFVPALDRPLSPLRDHKASGELRRIFETNKFQLVHTHGFKPGLVAGIAARRAEIPVVVHQAEAVLFHEMKAGLRRWLHGQAQRYSANHCDCMLFANREEREWFVKQGWIPSENCLTVYAGVDLQAYHPSRRAGYRSAYRVQWSSSEEEFVILFLGRLEYPKQSVLLAEIAARLDSLRPRSPWRLVVAGGGPDESQLLQAAKQAGIGHRVKPLGWQADPLGVLHAADVVVLPSLAEGLPRSLVEAQAAGLPVVASAIKGNREVVVEGTGLLCPAGNAAGFAFALARLIDSPQLRSTLGNAGRQHAEQAFDAAANNRQIVAAYESLLAS